MQYTSVDELKGNEILGVPILSSTDVILIGEGTRLDKDYIEKIKEMGIYFVYIKEESEIAEEATQVYSVSETYEESKKALKGILEKNVYKNNDELKKVIVEARHIMDSVTEKPEVIENLTEIRNISTDMYSHCINVCAMSTIMALRFRMTEKQVQDIAMGAILHDIGLRELQVPYIDIDMEELTQEEQEEYKKHTVTGYNLVKNEKWISDVAKEIILNHHEHVNGGGYPFDHKDLKLSQEVKLVTVCDDFDALISGIGRRKMKIYQAIEYIKVNAGIIYDRNVAEKILKTVAAYPVGTKVVLSDNSKGIVIKQNSGLPERPIVRITQYSNGKPVVTEVIKDLMKVLTLFIVDTVD